MKLLAAIDLSSASARVLAVCQRIAKAMAAEIVLVHVAEPDPDFVGYEAGPATVREQVAEEFRNEHRALQKHARALRDAGLDVTALLVQGPTVASVLAEAQRRAADLIVIGSHGHGAVYDLVAGSVSLGILRAADVPVIVVPTRSAD